MRVGEVLGMTPSRGKAGNLDEARALQMGRAAAARRDEDRLEGRKGKRHHGKTRRSRGSSLPPRVKPATPAKPAKRNKKVRSIHGTPRRASQVRNSLEARELTRDIFNSSNDDDDDTDDETKTPMPALDGSDDTDSISEGKEEEPTSKDTRLSLIATPVDERAKWESEDDEFIAPEGDPSVYGDDDDYVPSMSESSDESSGGGRGVRRHERAPRSSPRGSPIVGDRPGGGRGKPACYPGGVHAGARKASPDAGYDIEEVMEPNARKPEVPMGVRASGDDGIRVYAVMHDEARDAEEANRRRRALREADKGPGMRFNVGDYVMVSATKNQANRKRHNKNMVR